MSGLTERAQQWARAVFISAHTQTYADEFPVRPASPASSSMTEAELNICAGWATHAHEEIHRYLRQYQTILQIVVVTVTAALATSIQKPDFARPLIVVAPYVLGTAVIQWMNCVVEVMVFAAVIDEIEQMVRDSQDRWLLFQETVIHRSPPNIWGAASGNTLQLAFFAAASVASVVVGFRTMVWYGILNAIAVAGIAMVIAVHAKRIAATRTNVRRQIRLLRSPG